MSILREQKEKQSKDLQKLRQSKDELHEKAEHLAEGLMDIEEKHHALLERLVCIVLNTIDSADEVLMRC